MPEPRSPRRRATALSYKPDATAPRIVASGVGATAEQIINTAREAGVPLRKDPALVEALGALDLGVEIPEALYTAVAETLAWAYNLDQRAGAEQSR
jgi:flagellar biosynthesis protein